MKHIGLKIIACIFGIALWFYVVSARVTEIDIQVPLVFTRLPETLAIASSDSSLRFRVCEISKFLSELSTRVPRLYPVRSIRPMSFADARYWLHPIGETGQRIATFTRL